MALIQLRMALVEQAKPYRLGTSVDGTFAALRARFGISIVDARARLQRLCRETLTSLQDHATTVKRLAQIAYSDLPEAHRERYSYDAFVQSLNDLGLHHQLQAREVTTIEDTLCEGEAYLLAQQLHRAHTSCLQVMVEPLAEHNELLNQVATATHSLLEAEVDRMADMLEKLVAVLACASPTEPPEDLCSRRRSPPRPTALCWECGGRGHLRMGCPQYKKELNSHGPRVPPNTACRN